MKFKFWGEEGEKPGNAAEKKKKDPRRREKLRRNPIAV